MTTNHANFVICGCPWEAAPIETSRKLWKILIVVIVFLWIGNFIVKDYWENRLNNYNHNLTKIVAIDGKHFDFAKITPEQKAKQLSSSISDERENNDADSD